MVHSRGEKEIKDGGGRELSVCSAERWLLPRQFPSNLTDRQRGESAQAWARAACRGDTALAANR